MRQTSVLRPIAEATCREVVSHLNALTDRRFGVVARANVDAVETLLERGYGRDELIAVIEAKVEQAKRKPGLREWLRPDTLFDLDNFERYLANDVGSGAPAPDVTRGAVQMRGRSAADYPDGEQEL